MADHRRPPTPREWTETELERGLRALGADLAYPPTPDLAPAVRARLSAGPVPADRAWIGWRDAVGAWFAGLRPRRAVAVAVLALLLAAAAVLTAVPTARETVAGWIGVRGIRIVFVEDGPTPAPTPTEPAAPATPAALGGTLLLGERVSLANAQARVDFPLLLPDAALLGPPDEVYLRQRSDGAMVSLLYYPRPELPAAAETGVGLLLIQIEGQEGTIWLEKGVAPANEREIVQVDGDEALWLGGAHQLLIAPDPIPIGGAGEPEPESRIAGNVLLWDEDGVTYRLESGLSAAAAVFFAENLTPMATPGSGTPLP